VDKILDPGLFDETGIFTKWLRSLVDAKHRNLRLPVIIKGRQESCRLMAARLLQNLPQERADYRILIVGDPLPEPGVYPTIKASACHSWLGSTLDLLVFDSFSGLAIDALAALSGCIAGGGSLIWLLPNEDSVAEFMDPECARLFAYPSSPQSSRQVYVRYVLKSLQTLPCRLEITFTGTQGQAAINTVETAGSIAAATEKVIATETDAGSCLTSQDQVVQHIMGMPHIAMPGNTKSPTDMPNSKNPAGAVQGHHHRKTLVITADRGRGKSTALGIAAGNLMQNAPLQLIVTGHHPNSVQTVFQHASLSWPNRVQPNLARPNLARSDRMRPNLLRLNHPGGSSLTYRPPDDLLAHDADCDLLLIDEAATLPLPVLAKLLTRYPRIVMATTLAGYEGSGQGFRLKFLPALDALRPGWQKMHLVDPIRWAQGDPLEAFINTTLLCQETVSVPAGCSAPGAETNFSVIDWSIAWDREDRLRSLFALLALAHYRTTPEDLRSMLDSPVLDTVVMEVEGALAGVALIAREDPIQDSQLAAATLRGERRPRGLLSQLTLLQQVGLTEALTLPIARIVRIVVAPPYQRQKVGTACLNFLQMHYADKGYRLLTASFSLFPDVATFWRSNHFKLLRIGQRRDKVTATHSLLVGIALRDSAGQISLHDSVRQVVAQAVERCAGRFGFDLQCHFGEMDNQDITAILSYLSGQFNLSPEEIQLVERFCNSELSYECVEDLLQRLAFNCLGHSPLEPEIQELWLLRVIRQYDWNTVARLSAFKGKAAGTLALRRSAVDMLAINL
jgi:tRNA(Met) cytidine acetyltransferase